MIEPSYITAEMSDDFGEAVRLGAEAGIKTVSVRSSVWGQALEDVTDEDLGRMKTILSEHGIRVGTILSPVGKCNIEDAVQIEHHMRIFQRMVELAHTFGTRRIRIFPFQRPGFAEYEPSHLSEYLGLIVERLGPMVETAQAEDIILCFEWVGSTLAKTAAEVRRIVDALGNPPCVGVVWEIDVSCKAGELPSQGYPFVRGLVRDVHVKPNPQRCIDPVGTSTDTYENAFRSLLADGYEGAATIEHWGSTEGTLSGIRQLKALLDRVQGTRLLDLNDVCAPKT